MTEKYLDAEDAKVRKGRKGIASLEPAFFLASFAHLGVLCGPKNSVAVLNP